MAIGHSSRLMAMSGFRRGLLQIGARITTVDGPGYLCAAGHGFPTNRGAGAPITTADGIGVLGMGGTGSPLESGVLPG